MRRLQSDGSRLLLTSLIRDCRFDSSFLSLLLTPTGLSRPSMSTLYMEVVTLLSVDLTWSAARRYGIESSWHLSARFGDSASEITPFRLLRDEPDPDVQRP